MLEAGNILYFKPFYFPSGKSAPKNKYFIVLKKEDDKSIIASLPTSIDHVPEFAEKTHGCIQLDHINFNCYFFQKDKIVSDNGFSFPRDTYVYGEQVDVFNRQIFESIYSIENVDYEFICKLSSTEYDNLYNCIKSSPSVKRKIRRLMGAKI